MVKGFLARKPGGDQTGKLRTVRVPGVAGDEGQAGRFDTGDGGGVPVDFRVRLPPADVLDGDDVLEVAEDPRPLRQRRVTSPLPLVRAKSRIPAPARPGQRGGDVRLRGEFGKALEHALDRPSVRGRLLYSPAGSEGCPPRPRGTV